VKAATAPRDDPRREKLLCLDPVRGVLSDAFIADLPWRLEPGDLLVVNDAATLPASLSARGPGGEAIEVRLAGQGDDGLWSAVLFGAGDWRQRTEDRPAPAPIARGDRLAFGQELTARVRGVSDRSPRLVDLRFDAEGPALWSALYRLGRPVQYSYLAGAVPLGAVQTPYASRPWAVELPSAGRPLGVGLLIELRRRGIAMARVTHAAGLSATGDAALDAALPLPERFDVPAETVEAVRRTRARGGRVVAAGTTVVRALEGSAAASGELVAGPGITDLVVSAGYPLRVVDGLLTGLHEPGSSHYRLLEAFAPEALLERAFRHAEGAGYLAHEFGDSSLILQGWASASQATSAASFSS
jgi:S-adenosylmethionine:tRNA ribosyltransferase-isomerase